jgi:hypothetical protein
MARGGINTRCLCGVRSPEKYCRTRIGRRSDGGAAARQIEPIVLSRYILPEELLAPRRRSSQIQQWYRASRAKVGRTISDSPTASPWSGCNLKRLGIYCRTHSVTMQNTEMVTSICPSETSGHDTPSVIIYNTETGGTTDSHNWPVCYAFPI